ncbi:NAD(P)-binding protein [Neurospora crassa]|uniref:Short chain dehydrogenase n=1 Tax=Neurospora crassa (strain ATCC 24698 / 74-OR23-1A / CBS 708.71 / DSM 1257 / FGSC 987) TaxID=367110 RepID=V5IPR7_NEUCR|nr:short chain dehydrogenase [Neurospora crassa OR74A]ESA43725.1 short chain dehydrogenase [Neurospora crassa OR74A]KHE87249.1 NAD(P)-binding protein [Neurospora crassa]|eukprot:XP_011393715.1 short chain dehydrogenase [Neurospora crassa OR74A]
MSHITAIKKQAPANSLVWLVTGCSSGFGLEFYLNIKARGDYIIATARDLSNPNMTHCIQVSLTEENVSVYQLDVTASQESLNGIIAEAIKIYGRIDVLVNNAGYVALGGWEDMGYDGFVRQFETNVFGLLKVTNAVLPHMRERRSGTLVFMGSLSGWQGNEFCGAYAGSKFAVEGMVEALQKEVEQFGIRTLLFEPGRFRANLLSPSPVVAHVSKIDDYKEAWEMTLRSYADVDSKRRGDPAKAVEIIMDVVREETFYRYIEEGDVPYAFTNAKYGPMKLRLPLGQDAFDTIKTKCDLTLKVLDVWERLITSTDHNDVRHSDIEVSSEESST